MFTALGRLKTICLGEELKLKPRRQDKDPHWVAQDLPAPRNGPMGATGVDVQEKTPKPILKAQCDLGRQKAGTACLWPVRGAVGNEEMGSLQCSDPS